MSLTLPELGAALRELASHVDEHPLVTGPVVGCEPCRRLHALLEEARGHLTARMLIQAVYGYRDRPQPGRPPELIPAASTAERHRRGDGPARLPVGAAVALAHAVNCPAVCDGGDECVRCEGMMRTTLRPLGTAVKKLSQRPGGSTYTCEPDPAFKAGLVHTVTQHHGAGGQCTMHVPVPELTALFTAVAPHVPLEDRRRAAGVGAVPTDDLEAAWDKVATLLGVSDGAKAADLARTADPTSVAFIVRAGLDALARENYEDAHGNWPTCIDCGAALEVQHNHCDRCAGPADGALVWLRQETVAAVRRAVGSGQPAEHTAALVRVNRDLNEADLADDGEAAEGGHE